MTLNRRRAITGIIIAVLIILSVYSTTIPHTAIIADLNVDGRENTFDMAEKIINLGG